MIPQKQSFEILNSTGSTLMQSRCSNCGFYNPPGMRFCGNCGAKLSNLATGMLIPPAPAQEMGIMMGGNLMERMKQAGLEAAGQRRNVTILFTDLSGYTALAERMDGDDLYELIQKYIHLLINDVYKYEGIVDKLTGDGLMALFGAPISYENNAERGVRSALEMQANVTKLSREIKAQLGVDLHMRVGLHSGSVVVGGIGSDLMMDYTAIGDTVNLARRIEEAAPPGAVLVSEAVYRQVRTLFDCQQISVLNPKGIAHPVTAFRVLGVKVHPGSVRGVEGLRSPMVGRESELNLLKEATAQLVNRKQGQLTLITGEAGLGKSRLTAEFKEWLGKSNIRILEGQSMAYRRSLSYWIFQDIFYHYLHLPPNTPELQTRERLTQAIYQLMGNQAAESLPYLEHFLNLPYSDPTVGERLRYLDAGQLRQQIFLAVRDVLVLESYRQPLLLILDDLHWADEASLELLRFLLEAIRETPIFVLGISRQILPGLMTRTVEWAQQKLADRFRAIELQSLSIDQSERLLRQLLALPSLPRELRNQILQRSAGIPFYLEEILRMLIDEGVLQREDGQWHVVEEASKASVGVPDTLQGLILARFDRLDAVQRRVLQVASVIGKNFSLPVLTIVLQSEDPAQVHHILNSLVEREFILPNPSEVTSEYIFRHILTSDAIYGTILRRERSKIHGQVGEAIESLFADRLESQVELLANHYRYSPLLDRALNYLILSGQKSARNHANEQARQHFEAALELIPQVKPQAYQILQTHLGLGDCLSFFGDYPAARQHYETAMTAISGQTIHLHVQERATCLRKIANIYVRQGDYAQAKVYLQEGQKVLAASPALLPVEMAQTLNDMGWIHFRQGDLTEAWSLMQEALRLVESSDAYDAISSIYNRLGGLAYNQGEWERAASYLRKSIAIRESIRDAVGLATSFNNLGLLEIEMGEFDNALQNLTRSYELKTRLGQAEGITMALTNLGWLRIYRGELSEAAKALEKARLLAEQIGYSLLHRQIMRNIGEMHLAAQDWEKARLILCEILPDLLELSAYEQLIDTYRLLAEAALGAVDVEAAASWVQKAQELIEPLQAAGQLSAVQLGETRRLQGMLALEQKDWETAARFFNESEASFRNVRSRLYGGRVTFQRGRLAKAQGDRRSAQLHFREAALMFASVGAKLEQHRAEEACAF